jgi:hypothetical protein
MRGHLDLLITAGFIDGWACDDEQPLRPLEVAVLLGGAEIARATANIYRPDLADAGCATGWCAFRARLIVHALELRGVELELREVNSGLILHTVQQLPEIDISNLSAYSVDEIIAQDPTQLVDVRYLKGCRLVLEEFIKQRGAEDFVAAAFLYVLQRPVDRAGLDEYTHLIRQGLLTPLNMLYNLAESAEYRINPKALIAPWHPAFPFREF